MSIKKIPDGYRTITPYLTVADGAKLLDFLKRAFNAEVCSLHMRPDGSIGNAEIRIIDSMLMMGQAEKPWTPKPCSLYLYVEDADAVYEAALAAGGTSIFKPTDMFYGDRHGGVEDPCGNQWWIATHIEDVSPEEIERRAALQKN
jgi:PhnB protein